LTAEKDVMTESIGYAKRQELLVTSEQRTVLDAIIERLESWAAFTVQEITPVWYTVECLGKKFQLEVDNPGGNLDIVEIPMDDEELKFPRKSWAEDSVKLWTGNESFAERKIIAKFAILSDED
jgi:hypothetical protein